VSEGYLRTAKACKKNSGFSRNIGIINSLVVELWSLRNELLLTRSLNVLIIEIDENSVVDILSS
jgi:hypothetical protein